MNENLDTRLTDYALGELADGAPAEAEWATEADALARLGRRLREATVVGDATPAERNALLHDIIAAHLEAKAGRAAADLAATEQGPAELPEPAAAATSPAALFQEHAPLYRRAYVWGGLAVAASLLFVGVFTWPRPMDERDVAMVLPRLETGRTAPEAVEPGYFAITAGDRDRGRAQANLPLPGEPHLPAPTVTTVPTNRMGLEGALPTPAVTLPGNEAKPSAGPSAVKVNVDAVNVFIQNGAPMVAVLPQAPASMLTPSPVTPHGVRPNVGDFASKQREDRDAVHGETYNAIVENTFLNSLDAPLSTFSIDVDTASYSNTRRFLTSGQLPPRDAVRVEEFLNYFTYAYPQPKGEDPFSITTEAARCPWNAEHVLLRVGLKGRDVPKTQRPATNLVFLVDVSGSMQSANKLPLVRESLKMLVRELGDKDRVAIVVYAGNTGLALPSTGGDRKQTILEAIDRLEAGGSTNGAAGIQLAYQVAREHFIAGGVNRVVLATDGDFNVGITSPTELLKLIEEQAKSKVFFSGLAYGTGNLKDATLEQLADKGNGNYAYIDSLAEARKVLVEQMSGTLVTIAKDVKVQIEFNPTCVQAYRLIGYENRILVAEDFNNDKKDAGEIGAGHTVTALYELVPVGVVLARQTVNLPAIDPLKYQKPQPKPKPTPKLQPTDAAKSDELLTLKLRYKQPEGDVSKLIERPLKNDVKDYGKASGDFKFAAAVAAFGLLLRDSQHAGSATLDGVLELAQEGIGRDAGGYRREFLELVRQAKLLKPTSVPQ